MNIKAVRFVFVAAAACTAAAGVGQTLISTAKASPKTCKEMSLGAGASLNGFVPFPATDPFNQNISSSPVDSSSAAIIGVLGSAGLHPDFGAGLYGGSTIGIPYTVVSGQKKVAINYTDYGDESDAGPMPIPVNAHVEGYPAADSGDRHVLVLDENNCFLYELYNSYVQADGSWNASSGAVWDLMSDSDRPLGYTSADAAGLPIFPGLARYDEVAAGVIRHALRFTVQHTRAAYLLPAEHAASSSSNAAYPAMGTRFRLKASYDISNFPAQTKVILTALKTYGMIVADNGSNMYISGAPDDRWDNDDLHTLGTVPASAFEVVTTTQNTALAKGAAPTVSSFTSSAGNKAVAAGTPVELFWSTKGDSYTVVTPGPGVTRANTSIVRPKTTTTYTLYANNYYGSTTKTVTVTVK